MSPARLLTILLTLISLTVSGPDKFIISDAGNALFPLAFGDFNGDGKEDLVITDTKVAVPTGNGAVYVYYGKTGQDLSDYDVSFYSAGGGNLNFGQYAALTDLDHDGYDDLLIGEPNYAEFGTNIGRVYVVYGRPTFPKDNQINLVIPAPASFYGPANESLLGSGGAIFPGNVNGDNYNDILTVAGTKDAYLITGEASRFAGIKKLGSTVYAAKFTAEPRANVYLWPYSAAMGDVDGDGYDDVLIGDTGGESNKGRVALFYGGPALRGDKLLSNADAIFIGPDTQANLTQGLGIGVIVRDLDGDGKAEILIGHPYFDNGGLAGDDYGCSYIIKSKTARFSGPISLADAANYDARYIGQEKYEYLGTLNMPADLNGDGKKELIIGSLRKRTASASSPTDGGVYVVDGASIFTGDKSKSMSATTNYLVYFRETRETPLPTGYRLAMGFGVDVDADNIKDIVLGDLCTGGQQVSLVYNRFPQLALTAPNGGETLSGGASCDITWNCAQSGVFSLEAISLYYSQDGGTSYELIAANEPNDGLYAWTVPQLNNNAMKVKVTASNALKDVSEAVSAANFTITSSAPAVSVLYPNGGEIFKGSTIQTIRYSVDAGVAGLAANPINLYLSLDSGATFPTLLAQNKANTGTYDWTVPAGIDKATARIKVTAVNNMGLTGEDRSDRDFVISQTSGVFEVKVLEVKSGPSPFSPGGAGGLSARGAGTAQIDYKLSGSGAINIYIFDAAGKLVYKRDYLAGTEGGHVGMNSVPWDGRDASGNILPNGVYIIKITSGATTLATDKIMIIK